MPSSRCRRAHQPQHLRLHRDVERGGGFIGDQQTRPARQRDRDHHPLPHPARELERIAGELARGIGDAHALQHPPRLRHRGGLAHALVQHQRLGDLLADAQHRVEAGHRLLEHHRDLGAAQPAHRLLALAGQVADGALAVAEADRAGLDPAAREVEQAGDGERGDGLAGAALAHHRDGLAFGDGEIEGARPP